MIFFCPRCWKEVKRDDKKCLHCGADITEHERKGFEEKLINALGHPERETVQRAVWILGRLKSLKAIKPLIKLFERTDDPFLKRDILQSLLEIGTDEAKTFIRICLDSEITVVRKKAEELVSRR